jgi:hypothetical protein
LMAEADAELGGAAARDPRTARPASPAATTPDAEFCVGPSRHPTRRQHRAVGRLYEHLGTDGSKALPRRVLDLMSSWISHSGRRRARRPRHEQPSWPPTLPRRSGWSRPERRPCSPSPMATSTPSLLRPVDYLTRPVGVPRRGRVLRPGGLFVVTFSTAASRLRPCGWLATNDEGRHIVTEYFRRAGVPPGHVRSAPAATAGDPVRGVGDQVAQTMTDDPPGRLGVRRRHPGTAGARRTKTTTRPVTRARDLHLQ